MGVPFARPDCSGNELEYVREVLESGWLTTGAKAREFEERFADAIGATHALAVNSCTAALHLACEAVGVGPGSRVVVPSLTFTATAEVFSGLWKGRQVAVKRLAAGEGRTSFFVRELGVMSCSTRERSGGHQSTERLRSRRGPPSPVCGVGDRVRRNRRLSWWPRPTKTFAE